ncbi:MAG: diguanylate cyclase, partial [Smithellaceae bacterium]|nr:diguanylate cyclase [Smithellaceae bacterium]
LVYAKRGDMRILIAGQPDDDNARLGEILAEEGFEYIYTENGHGVINLVYQELPDVILLNLSPPGEDSLALLARLKAAPSTREIPVLLITARRLRRKLSACYKLGAFDYFLKPYFREEIAARLRNVVAPLQQMRDIQGAMDRDYLTGLFNRRFFMERFAEEISWIMGYHEPLSLLLINIDHFKKVNDTYGHACGDEVLKHTAAIILSKCRAEDVVARFGGEEFVILMPNTGLGKCEEVAEDIRAAVENAMFVNEEEGLRLPVTISIGGTSYQATDPVTTDSLLGEADSALYTAKGKGRNIVVMYAQDP